MNIKESLIALVDEGRDLDREEATDVMRDIMRAGTDQTDGPIATESQFGAFVTAMRIKGETVDELAGMATAMREFSLKVDNNFRPLLDTAGTGGSGKKRFNASTAAAFVAAAGGAKVAKHGNRAMTSKSGAADFLESLGAEIAISPEKVNTCLDLTGIGFMFAPVFHPAMRFAAPIRPSLGFRTAFNILGPLTNPAGANCHVLGAANIDLGQKLSQVLCLFDMRHALVVVGHDGVDDISVTGESTIFEVKEDKVEKFELSPEELGLPRHSEDELVGGTSDENAEIWRSVLAGNGPLAIRNLVAAQAGAGLYVTGLASTIRSGCEQAISLIESGDVSAKVAAFIEATRK